MFQNSNSRKAWFAGKKAASAVGQPPLQGPVLPGFTSNPKPIKPEEDEFKPKTPKFPRIQSMMKIPKIPKV